MNAAEVAAALRAKLSPEEFEALRGFLLDSGGVTIVHAALMRAIDKEAARAESGGRP